MTPDPASDKSFADLLVACDEAIGAGSALPRLPEGDDTSGLARAVDYLYRLNQWKADRAPVQSVGRFRIRRELGRGGFGIVYLAFDPRLGRDVALKVPRPDVLTSPDLRERFRREARVAAGLDHPNIVPIYEAGEAGPAYYIAAAYCPGPTLREWFRRRTEPVPFADAAALVASLADGAGHAHARGIVHRDLKPGNVLLNAECRTRNAELETRPDLDSAFCVPHSALVPKITDFGLAKLSDPDDPATRTGAVLGTPAYMAPEQAAGAREIGPAADVYALGVILYELLTGRPPFVGETDLDTVRQVETQEPVPPSRLRLRLPRDLETVCLKCLEKDPRRRYGTGAELAADLRRFLGGQPVTARRVGAVGRAWKRARRHPVAAGLLAALFALAVGSGAAVTVLWRQTKDALANETAARGKTEAGLAEKLTILARIEWEADRRDRAIAYLDECPEAHRGREWRYLDRMCRSELMTLPHPGDGAPTVTYSPDGRLIVATSKTRLRVWDLATRAEVFGGELDRNVNRWFGFSPDGRELTLMTFLPQPDEQKVEAPRKIPIPYRMDPRVAGDRTVWRLTAWDVGTGAVVRQSEFARPVSGPVAHCPVGPLFASGVGDRVRVENLATGRVVEFAHGHAALKALEFGAGGRHLLSVGAGDPMKVWDSTDGRLLYAPAIPGTGIGHYHPRREVLSPDGRRVAAWRTIDDGNTMLEIWDAERGRELAALPRGRLTTHGYRVSPDGRSLAVADGNLIRVWDLTAGGEMLVLRGHTKSVFELAFGPDGRRLASVGLDQTLRVWDVSPFEE